MCVFTVRLVGVCSWLSAEFACDFHRFFSNFPTNFPEASIGKFPNSNFLAFSTSTLIQSTSTSSQKCRKHRQISPAPSRKIPENRRKFSDIEEVTNQTEILRAVRLSLRRVFLETHLFINILLLPMHCEGSLFLDGF
jgi:hypothetical protein